MEGPPQRLLLFVSAAHEAGMELLCKQRLKGSPFGSAVALATELGRLGLGYVELIVACTVLENVASPAVVETLRLAAALRALRAFASKARALLELHLRNAELAALALGSAGSSKKGAVKNVRGELKRWLTLADACCTTASACAQLVSGSNGNHTLSAIQLVSPLHRLEFAAHVQAALLAFHGLQKDGVSPLSLLLRKHIVDHTDTQLGSVCCERALCGDDVFLVEGHQTSLLLLKLAAMLVPCGVHAFTSVALDTATLDDYRALRCGVGLTVSRMFWHGTQKRPDRVCIERCVLEQSAATLRQRMQMPGLRSSFDELLRGGGGGGAQRASSEPHNCHGGNACRDSVAWHVVDGCRGPIAAYTCVRHSFVSAGGQVVVTVDSNVCFAPLSGNWERFATALLGDIADARHCVRFPHAVVSVSVSSYAPPWLKQLFKWPALHYQPNFTLHGASVACCYGDHGFPLSPFAVDAAAPALQLSERLDELKKHERFYKKMLRGKTVPEDQGYNMQEVRAQKILLVSRSASSDPKTYMTNERTAFAWMETATFLALNALSLFAVNSQATRVGGLLACVVAAVFAGYALFRWQWRQRSLNRGRDLSAFVDRVGPLVAVVSMASMLVGQVAISNLLGVVVGAK